MERRTRRELGEVEGVPVSLHTLTNARGLVARVMSYGATLAELHVPDRDGRLADVVLGFDTLEEYLAPHPYFGCVVGRCANRIAHARFELAGETHFLTKNHGRHHIHGGERGFDKVAWEVDDEGESAQAAWLTLRHRSRDGEEGYPGEVTARVTYTLADDDSLAIEATATSDRTTPVNLVGHSYWNLAGHDRGTVLAHHLRLEADHYTPTDAELIPTGAIESVSDTPYDFRASRSVARALDALGDDADGFDLNYVLRKGRTGELALAATLSDPASGRALELWTDQPGLQLYTGNSLGGERGKSGARYPRHAGLCLEAQRFPDAIHHAGRPGWPSVLLPADETYRSVAHHRFTTLS